MLRADARYYDPLGLPLPSARFHHRPRPARLLPARYGVVGGALSAAGPGWAAPRAAPAQATITQTIAAHSLGSRSSLSSTRPTSAATAGSRLIQMPNTRAGIRRSASSSSRYGMTEDSSPTAAPVPSTP